MSVLTFGVGLVGEAYNVQRSGRHVLTPSLARGTLTILDASGRVAHETVVAAAAHDACVLR